MRTCDIAGEGVVCLEVILQTCLTALEERCTLVSTSGNLELARIKNAGERLGWNDLPIQGTCERTCR